MDHSVCLLLLLATVSSVYAGQFPTAQTVKEWVDQMQNELVTMTDTASGLHDLIKIYKNHKAHFSVETNNARALVSTAAGNIEGLLANRSQALKRNRAGFLVVDSCRRRVH